MCVCVIFAQELNKYQSKKKEKSRNDKIFVPLILIKITYVHQIYIFCGMKARTQIYEYLCDAAFSG